MIVGDFSSAPVRVNDKHFVIHSIIGSDDTVAQIPHVQSIELPEGIVQTPHYHEIDQYQMVIGGSGRIGNHPVAAGTYHYTDRCTTYGPIIGSPGDDLHYLVLRPRGEEGVSIKGMHMPESRELRSRRPGRHFYGTIPVPGNADEGRWAAETDYGKGGVVTSVVVEADALVPEPQGRSNEGPGYLVVLDGVVTVDGQSLSKTSVVWIEVSDPWPAMIAGAEGVSAAWFSFTVDHAR